ncbi:histone-binding protein N1/N2 isoform X3 [Salmo trutta]|uniref:histone-binding protein N1/N2 isoform X3 n=1 Tax=Salmo trutta TaxID=8032 RepID=UPI0011318554|nr:histone-binding protein N1/N2-like isoform X3 [Salmo trutta]
MPEEIAAASNSASMEEKSCSSSAVAADSSVDVMAEAKKLIGAGNRHLVMGDVVSAVNVFQEACGMLAERYGDTADECGEAFFLCGKSLLELARMENTVLGDALEGVPEGSSEEGEKQENSKFESADNLDEETRDKLRMQVYDAMAEKETTHREDGATEPKGKMETTEEGAAKSPVKNGNEHFEPPVTGLEKTPEGKVTPVTGVEKTPVTGVEKTPEGKVTPVTGVEKTPEGKVTGVEKTPVTGVEKTPEGKAEGVKTEELNGNGKEVEGKMEEEGEDDDDDDDDEGEGTAEDKESEEEVGNLQLAWEMLEVAKVIYKRKANEADQLMAAQAYLKLGEVGAESGNYPAAVEDFQDCLALQLKHLPPHSRLLAETHYQLGMTYCYTGQYSQAIQHYSSSVKVIEGRLAMLQEVLDKGENGAEGKTELEELKLLLPDIAEKVEDAKESQRMAGSASVAIQQTLAGASTSSAFPASAEKSGPSAFEASQIAVTSAADGVSSNTALDISHLVRKKRKMEESPIKDTDAKKNKQETTVNGSGDSGSASNEVQEKGAQEPAKPSSDSSV